jgi:hypothetical protein
MPDKMKPVAIVHEALGCMNVQFGEKSFLMDFADYNRLAVFDKPFRFVQLNDVYPAYCYNYKDISLLEFIYDARLINVTCTFHNNNPCDLRRCNWSAVHNKDGEVRAKYNVLEYVPGHFVLKGTTSKVMRNPMWKIRSDDGSQMYLMYCGTENTDKFCLVCDQSLAAIAKFEETLGRKLSFYANVENDYIRASCGLAMHQIITGCYGNGSGLGTISVDHIDRNPANNCFANLRVATMIEQLQNRKRNNVPDGMSQDQIPMYVVYYKEVYNKEKNLTREFFKIENHPKQQKPWMSSKSNKVALEAKLADAKKVLEDLDHGIHPTLQCEMRGLPPCVCIQKFRGMDNLVYDKRQADGERLNLRMCMHDGYDLAQELPKFEAKLKKKYPELEFDFQLE